MGKIHDRFKGKKFGTIGHTRLNAYPVARPLAEPLAPAEHNDFEVQRAFSKQKYIIAKHPALGDVALVFPNFLVHADMPRAVFRRMEIAAAGFFCINPDNTVRAYGRSESLNRDSRPLIDAELIERSLGIG